MVNVNNEWGKLKEVIVGTVDNANMPTHGKDLHCINYATDDSIPKNELGFWDQKVYEETYEDLENLSNLLTDVGVKVYRPTPIDTTQTISNGHWETTKFGAWRYKHTATFLKFPQGIGHGLAIVL